MNNAIKFIKDDLQNHKVQVKLPGENTIRELYLIMVTALTNKAEEVSEVYGNQVTATHLKIIEKIYGKEKSESVYGVLLDGNLEMIFAFNRGFADYNRKKEQIIYKDIDEITLGKLDVKPDGAQDSGKPPHKPLKLPSYPSSVGGDSSAILRYSLAEKKE